MNAAIGVGLTGLVFLALTVAGCDSSDRQAEAIQRVLLVDRQVSESLNFPNLIAVEKLREIDLSGCPHPFRDAFTAYVQSAQRVVEAPVLKLGREEVEQAMLTLQRTQAEVSRVALAYGVVVE